MEGLGQPGLCEPVGKAAAIIGLSRQRTARAYHASKKLRAARALARSQQKMAKLFFERPGAPDFQIALEQIAQPGGILLKLWRSEADAKAHLTARGWFVVHAAATTIFLYVNRTALQALSAPFLPSIVNILGFSS